MTYYSRDIEMPKNAQEGIMNFVQMIINNIEAGNTEEALLQAVDLHNDLQSEIYKVTMDSTPTEHNVFVPGNNVR